MTLRLRVVSALLALLALYASPSAAPQQSVYPITPSNPARRAASEAAEPRLADVPRPREVLGFEPGDDRKLADWSQIVDYFKKLDSASPRVQVHQPGLSTERRPFIYAIISSEENI